METVATEKQVKMIRHLERKLGREPEMVVDAMTKESASQYIDQLKRGLEQELVQDEAPERKQKPMTSEVRFSDPVFGMACKLLVQDTGYGYWLENQAEFHQKAAKLYAMLTEARERTLSASSFSSFDFVLPGVRQHA